MKTFHLIIFSVLMISACRRINEIPAGVLSKEKMIEVMTDFQLAESALNIRQLNADDLYKKEVGYNKSVLTLHDVSAESFETSFKYYSAHPDLFEEIYEEVINELSKREAEMK